MLMPEKELRDALHSVRAPEGLWERIEQRLDAAPSSSRGKAGANLGWMIAAGVMVTLGASWLALWGREPDHVALLRELCGHPERLDVRTAELSMVRQFAARHGHVMHVPGGPSAAIQLIGAKRLAGKDRIGVAYRAGGAWSALVVEPADGRDGAKIPVRRDRDGITIYQWRAGNEWYTLLTTLSRGAERACGICHFDRPGAA
jgi:hypothetical protein